MILDGFSRALLSSVGKGLKTSLAISRSDSEHHNLLKKTSPFFGAGKKSYIVPYYSYPWFDCDCFLALIGQHTEAKKALTWKIPYREQSVLF